MTRARRPRPARLWTAGEELPLFSGTPIRPAATDTPYAEIEHGRQIALPGLAAEVAWRTWQIADTDKIEEEQE